MTENKTNITNNNLLVKGSLELPQVVVLEWERWEKSFVRYSRVAL